MVQLHNFADKDNAKSVIENKQKEFAKFAQEFISSNKDAYSEESKEELHKNFADKFGVKSGIGKSILLEEFKVITGSSSKMEMVKFFSDEYKDIKDCIKGNNADNDFTSSILQNGFRSAFKGKEDLKCAQEISGSIDSLQSAIETTQGDSFKEDDFNSTLDKGYTDISRICTKGQIALGIANARSEDAVKLRTDYCDNVGSNVKVFVSNLASWLSRDGDGRGNFNMNDVGKFFLEAAIQKDWHCDNDKLKWNDAEKPYFEVCGSNVALSGDNADSD